MVVETLESTLIDLHHFLLNCSWRVDLLDSLTALVSASSHYVLLHLEFEAAVITHQSFVLSLLILGQHQWRIAVLSQMTFAVLSEFLEHFIL